MDLRHITKLKEAQKSLGLTHAMFLFSHNINPMLTMTTRTTIEADNHFQVQWSGAKQQGETHLVANPYFKGLRGKLSSPFL